MSASTTRATGSKRNCSYFNKSITIVLNGWSWCDFSLSKITLLDLFIDCVINVTCKFKFELELSRLSEWHWWHNRIHISLIKFTILLHFYSLWPSDGIWHNRFWSTWCHVMACCLAALGHYLNQCWPITDGAPWHAPKGKLTKICSKIICYNDIQCIWKLWFHNYIRISQAPMSWGTCNTWFTMIHVSLKI